MDYLFADYFLFFNRPGWRLDPDFSRTTTQQFPLQRPQIDSNNDKNENT